MSETGGKLIFISHSSKDVEIVNAFVDLILQNGLSVSINDVFCTSTDGAEIKSGDDWRNAIRDNLLSAKIIFLIITPNYKESEICMNEMGAAWITDAKVLPLIVPPINYKSVGVIQEPKQIEELLDEGSLDNIRDIVQEVLEIPSKSIKSKRWSAKKEEFIIRVGRYLSESEFSVPLDRNKFNELLRKNKELKKTVKEQIREKKELQELVAELKRCKDKDAVKAVLHKRNPNSQFEEFVELCEAVRKLLFRNSCFINGIIYKSYSGKSEIPIDCTNYSRVIAEALADEYINEELEINWTKTTKMKSIYNALEKLNSFINGGDLSDEFFEEYEEKYEAPMELQNKLFWEEVLSVEICFS